MTLVGQCDSIRMSFKETDTQLILKAFDRGADGRLRYIQICCREGDLAGISCGNEVSNLSKGHHFCLISSVYCCRIEFHGSNTLEIQCLLQKSSVLIFLYRNAEYYILQ